MRDLPIALTLFRGTRRTAMTDGQPQGQLRGNMTFRYWIVPFRGRPDRKRLFDLGQQLAAGLRDVQLRPADMAVHRGDVALPTTGSFLSVEGPAVVTSARRVADGLEVRMFNPTDGTIQATIRLGDAFGSGVPTAARYVDFESNPLGETKQVVNGLFTIELGAKKIATLRYDTEW